MTQCGTGTHQSLVTESLTSGSLEQPGYLAFSAKIGPEDRNWFLAASRPILVVRVSKKEGQVTLDPS